MRSEKEPVLVLVFESEKGITFAHKRGNETTRHDSVVRRMDVKQGDNPDDGDGNQIPD